MSLGILGGHSSLEHFMLPDLRESIYLVEESFAVHFVKLVAYSIPR